MVGIDSDQHRTAVQSPDCSRSEHSSLYLGVEDPRDHKSLRASDSREPEKCNRGSPSSGSLAEASRESQTAQDGSEQMIGLVIAALGSISVLTFVSYLQLRSRASTEYATAASAFFAAADTLASCDDVPSELTDALSAMNETISDRRAANGLLAYLSAEARWKDMNSESFLRRKKTLTEFFARRPELEATYHQAVVNWFLAITALSPLVGKLARVAMTEDTVEAVAGSRRRFRGDRNNISRAQPARA